MDIYQCINGIINSDVATICSTILLISFTTAIVVCIIVWQKNRHERKRRKMEIDKEKWDKLASIRKEIQLNTLEVVKKQIESVKEHTVLDSFSSDYDFNENNK